ncbi:hypothetical protein B0T18DRAFT_95820 [Schizothecium vesticola]|uniref:Uncharacterized protein n=1 Tax=Schizothecium vesticola TaxID=314040 RepID=A0AA40F0P1_9PEZI|nr:hypothetical protein B0T18DRAFT_95820 [Schizothecium vesticola]
MTQGHAPSRLSSNGRDPDIQAPTTMMVWLGLVGWVQAWGLFYTGRRAWLALRRVATVVLALFLLIPSSILVLFCVYLTETVYQRIRLLPFLSSPVRGPRAADVLVSASPTKVPWLISFLRHFFRGTGESGYE